MGSSDIQQTFHFEKQLISKLQRSNTGDQRLMLTSAEFFTNLYSHMEESTLGLGKIHLTQLCGCKTEETETLFALAHKALKC